MKARRESVAQVRALGMTLTRRAGEYRVNFRGGGEETAYYTPDLGDAVGTAHAMHACRPVDLAEAQTIAAPFSVRVAEAEEATFHSFVVGKPLGSVVYQEFSERATANMVKAAADRLRRRITEDGWNV